MSLQPAPLQLFHPTVQRWFSETLGAPTPAQTRGWPLIRSGAHVLIAAPTGSGKTLAAFLSALDTLFALGDALPDETRVLYVSPLKALSNDVRKNLAAPLAELRARDATLPEIRVAVRTGDTPARERAAMLKKPPHVLVTTPESLYILLTSAGGRARLRNVRTVIVDEIHAVLGDKRGAHLALSLERLAALTRGALAGEGGDVQRIGLSATQRPLVDVGRFLTGAARTCELVDEGHLRALDVAVWVPPSPLDTVCSHETWSEIYARIAELVRAHKTTLVFAGTRKLAERASAQLQTLLGVERVTCHHSSLAKERRLDAEERLKAGQLSALVATASLELGIDIGDVDLVVQIGATKSIATLLQRVGRAGHGVGRTPKGVLLPLTRDELVESAALVRAVTRGELDRTPQPSAPLDILAQQIVAACAHETWDADELFALVTRAWPYRELARERFDAVVALHTDGRNALLHRAEVDGRVRLRGTRRAPLAAVTSGGAIPDSTQYRVVLEPEGTTIGAVDEDFAIESSSGDVFQLGASSWRVLRVERGTLRVADAHGVPPSLPFWLGEAPARTRELSAAISEVREHGADTAWVERECSLPPTAAQQLAEYVSSARAALGVMPTTTRFVLERFFDESGGMQLVLHAPLGGRINRAFGLALRKRFCRSFGFELQAAANEDAIVISLGPQHSFPLAEVFDYLHPATVRDVLVQALLAAPLFTTRWRWNVSRALLVERMRGGQRVPPPILRMRAGDLLAQAFPAAVACGETLPPGDIEVPEEHPIVAQTIADCLHEALDLDGLVAALEGLRSGAIERFAIDTTTPSPFARGVLAVRPYGFLDDAPLEERRTQAVYARRNNDARETDVLGALDPVAVARVRDEAWPDPRDAEELHEALGWMGFVTDAEAAAWEPWIAELARAGRIVHDSARWFAVEATREPLAVLRGRLEALGPVHADDVRLGSDARANELVLRELEASGAVLRLALDGREAWCERRLLARIRRYTLDTLRREIEPVSTADLVRFLAVWQHARDDARLDGPAGVLEIVKQLAGFEAPAVAWEREIFARRVRGYRMEWLDELCLSGRVAWGRLWSGGRSAPRSTPISFFPRDELELWHGLAPRADATELTWPARATLDALVRRGALFQHELAKQAQLLPSDVERGLIELAGEGFATSDSFASFRALLLPSSKRREPLFGAGRWSLFRTAHADEADANAAPERSHNHSAPDAAETVARVLLRRHGVIFRTLLARERQPVPWRDLARACRALELRGDIRGGRFVAGHSGEQFALPEAIPLLRRVRRESSSGETPDDLVIPARELGAAVTPAASAPIAD